jgi:anti-sigma B factor antagonist
MTENPVSLAAAGLHFRVRSGGTVALTFQSRRIGDITVVACTGRIVEGKESAALQQCLSDALELEPYIILDLRDVDFIDSSGVGLLVRYLTRIQNAHGSLKLCAPSAKITEVLKVTRLHTVFESYESEADAVAAFYRRSRTADMSFGRADILCVEQSADVQAYVREVLRQGGYAVMTTGNLPDAVTLLTAMRPKLVVVGSELRGLRNTRVAETFNGLAGALAVIELPAGFSSDDAGHAGQQLLDQVRAILGSAGQAAVTR